MERAVLIVDDDPPLLSLLGLVVSREANVEVVSCRDGEEAIQALSERHFDVVLLDLMMPKRNGFDVIDYLRRSHLSQLRAVMVLTADTDRFEERLEPGVVHAIIEKPFDTGLVVGLVRDLLSATDDTSH